MFSNNFVDILTPAPLDKDKGTIVCHQVNCMGKMGAGLAKEVKRIHPHVYDVYLEKCKAKDFSTDLLGEVQFVSCLASHGYIIANIFGQYRYGRDTGRCYTDYEALKTAFENISKSFPDDIIRIPYQMGCGLAGGDWEIVSQLIQTELIDKGVKVEIWKY